MATVKKANTAAKKVDVKVETPIVEEVKEEVPVVEVLDKVIEEKKVDINKDNVDESKIPEKDVKIKLKEDHRCWVGRELYDFKKGKTYNVPKELKMRLASAGVLMPL